MIRLSIRTGPVPFPPHIAPNGQADIWLDVRGQEYGSGLAVGDEYYLKIHRVGAFRIERGYSAAIGYPEPGVDLSSFQAAFFHGVAPWLLQRQDWDCLHASAVLIPAGVVIFCGPSGCGKSTLARAWSERGAAIYADDAAPFLVRDGVAMSARIPQRLRLREPAASHFPIERHDPFSASSASRELTYDLEPTLRPVSSIYWPEPAAGGMRCAGPVIERVPATEAFSLLLSEAHCMSLRDPACNRKMVRNYLSLVRSVPVFRLRYPLHLDLLPAVLAELERCEKASVRDGRARASSRPAGCMEG